MLINLLEVPPAKILYRIVLLGIHNIQSLATIRGVWWQCNQPKNCSEVHNPIQCYFAFKHTPYLHITGLRNSMYPTYQPSNSSLLQTIASNGFVEWKHNQCLIGRLWPPACIYYGHILYFILCTHGYLNICVEFHGKLLLHVDPC